MLFPVVDVETNSFCDAELFDIKVEAENTPCDVVKCFVIWPWEVSHIL